MRVAELVEPGRIRIADRPLPDPGPGQVQVHVGAVGICGSDLTSFTTGGIGGAACRFPQILGHEPAGFVVKAGAGVTGWSAGDRAALEPALYCYHCEFCTSGRHNICSHIQFHSSDDVPGFFREYINLPAENLLPLPAVLSLEEASLFEPLAVVLHSIKLARIEPMETAAVFGAGPIGLMTICALRISGAGRIWAIEPVAHRRELAKAVGADATIDPHDVDAASEILLDSGGRGVDVAIDCATRETSLNQCVAVTRSGGRVVVTGIPHELELALNWHLARRKELVIYNVRRSNHESHAALQILAEQASRFRPLLTHCFPLERTQAAFEMLRGYSDGVGKAIVVFT
jgi:L-iditol 2-dehydrogenase